MVVNGKLTIDREGYVRVYLVEEFGYDSCVQSVFSTLDRALAEAKRLAEFTYKAHKHGGARVESHADENGMLEKHLIYSPDAGAFAEPSFVVYALRVDDEVGA